MKKSTYYFAGVALCLIAAVYFVFALKHPEASFAFPNWVTYSIYALYAIYTILIFCMPKFKDASIAHCLILATEFLALALILISIGSRFENGETNWYLPAGLFLVCFGNFANVFLQKKNNKAQETVEESSAE